MKTNYLNYDIFDDLRLHTVTKRTRRVERTKTPSPAGNLIFVICLVYGARFNEKYVIHNETPKVRTTVDFRNDRKTWITLYMF